METLELGYLGSWILGVFRYMGILELGHLGAEKIGYLGSWILGVLVHGNLDTCTVYDSAQKPLKNVRQIIIEFDILLYTNL